MSSSIDIIIVNWNGGRQLRDCLATIAKADRNGLELQRVVVVDNASIDGSLQMLDAVDLPLTLVRNPVNRGFAAASNQGAQESQADYLLFVNPDTRLDRRALTAPIAVAEHPENQRVGIIGIQLVDDSGRVLRTCARFPTARRFLAAMVGLDRALPTLFRPHFMLEWDHAEDRDVDQVMGAFFLVRRSLFKELNGFDERFFVYFEEVDFSVRARARGWRTRFVTQAQAFHRGGGATEHVRARRLFYLLRSRIRYAQKHFDNLAALLVTLGTLFVEPFTRFVLTILRRSPGEFINTVKGYGLLWAALLHHPVTPTHPEIG